nr:hypothetical protein [Tanacetum cinerariifolium]
MTMRVGVLCLPLVICFHVTMPGCSLFFVYAEMDLFSFINHANPTKVRIGKKQVEEGQTPLLESTRGHVGVNIIAEEEVEATIADKPKGFRKKRKVAGGASGSNLPPTKVREDHGTSGVSTGWSLLGGHTDSITGPNLQTQHPAEMFVISSDSPCHSSSNAADAEVSFAVRSFVSDPPIMTTTVATMVVSNTSSIPVNRAGDELVHTSIFADSTSIGMDMDSETLRQVYVPKWNIVNEFSLDDPDVCRSLVDQLAPPVLFSSFVEAEAAEAIHVRGQVSVAEAAKAARVRELDRLKARNLVLEGEKSTLDGQVTALESSASAKEAECASLSYQTAKLTQDLSNLQLSFDELNVKAASLERQKDNLASQVSSLDATCAGLREQISGYEFSKEQYKAVQDEQHPGTHPSPHTAAPPSSLAAACNPQKRPSGSPLQIPAAVKYQPAVISAHCSPEVPRTGHASFLILDSAQHSSLRRPSSYPPLSLATLPGSLFLTPELGFF